MLLATTTVPSDPRLATVRAELAQVVERAAQDGLPTDVLVAKIQEALAKSVPPPRILAVVHTLASDLASARAFAAPLMASGKEPQVALLRALAETKAAGVALPQTTALVRTGGDRAVKAVQVLTDLATRGYPATNAAAVVALVLTRDPLALPKLAGNLDRLRRAQGLTELQALDDLASAFERTDSTLAAPTLGEALQHIYPSAEPGNSPTALERSPNRNSGVHNHGKGHGDY